MWKQKLIILIFLLVLPAGLMATPQYHDYSQYPHWKCGFFPEGDDITSVSLCQIQGTTYWATTGQESGLCFFEIHDDGLELVYSHPMPGVEQGVVFQDTEAYVIARPNRLTKFLIYSVTNPLELWTDQLPGNPWDIKEYDDYLLLACGQDGLMVYDPTLMFNLPTGVVASLPAAAQEIHIKETMLVVRTDQGISTLDFSDPLNPLELGSIEVGPTLAMAVIDDLVYVSSGEDVIEVDIRDPANPVALRTMSHPFDHFPVTAILPTFGGLNMSAGSKMHFLDLESGEVSWTLNDFPRGQELAQYGDFMVMAAGVYGFQVYVHRPPAYAPASDPFGPAGNLKDLQIVGDFLFGYYSEKVECYNLAAEVPTLIWAHESGLNNEYVKSLVVGENRAYIGYNNGRIRILEYDLQSWTELAYFQSASEVVVDMAPLPGHLAVFGYPSDDIYLQRVLEIFDLIDLSNPVPVSSQEENSFPRMSASGQTLILWDHTSNDNGAKLIDAQDPQNPVVASWIPTPYYSELTVNNNTLYLVEPPLLQAVDISDPYSPHFGPDISINQGWYLETHGQFGYLLYTDLVFDLSDPLQPVVIGSTNNEWTSTVHYCAAGDGYLVTGSSGTLVLMAEQGYDTSPVPNTVPAAAPIRLTAFPNPFNPQVQLSFHLDAAGLATIGIFDVKGRRVASREVYVASTGTAMVSWDGQDQEGKNLPSGVYLVQVLTAQGQEVGKVVLAR